MTMNHTNELSPRKPLRLWPAVAIAVVQLLVMFGAPVVAPDAEIPIGMLGGVVGALAILVWWLLFSRARWFERVGAIVLMIVAVLATRTVVHESMAGAGQGMLILILPAPYLGLALVAWAVATRHLQDGVRRAALGCGDPARVRAVCAHPNAGVERHRFGVPLAVDADSRGTAAGPGRRRAQAAAAAGGSAHRGDSQGDTDGHAQRDAGSGSRGSSRSEDRSRRAGGRRRRQPSGPAFADPSATASFAACGSRPTGRRRRRSRCGAGRSGRAGRPSRCTAISSTRRSSAVTTRSSPATE